MRRTGYTKDGRQVLLRFNDKGLLTSYRVAGRVSAVSRRQFQSTEEFYSAVARLFAADPRPRGLPRI